MGISAVIGGALIGGFASDWDPWGVIGGGLLGFGGGALLGAGGAAAGLGGIGYDAIGASLAGELGAGIGYDAIGASLAGGGLGEFASAGLAGIGGWGGGAALSDFGLGSFLGGYGGADFGYDAISASLGGGGGFTASAPGAAVAAGGGGGGILPPSLANIGSSLARSPLQTLSQGAQLFGNLQNKSSLEEYRKRMLEAANRSDPFGPQRAQYQQQLSELMANPSSVQNLPGYQAQYNAMLEGLQRTQAAQGKIGGGEAKQQIASLAGQMQGQYYNQEVERLMALAGAGISPAQAGQIQATGAANYMGGSAQNVANTVYGLQNIANLVESPAYSPLTEEEDQYAQNISQYLF